MTAPDRLEVGAVLDGFRLEEIVHRGSMSTIWKVTAPGTTEPLAMKIPRLSAFENPAAIVGFEVEQMILPTLSGPHVPRFVAAGDFSVRPYIVTEFLKGPSLRPRIDEAPLAHEQLAPLGARIATALHDVHSQHVIHFDVKPSNVMFRESGEAVLIDYGLAQHARLPDFLAEEFRLPMGTAPYMSPEQVRHIRTDPRSDLFALGVLLYYFATGQRPFGNPTSLRGLRQRLHRDPIPPRIRTPAVPPWMQEVILRCLEIDPRKRYDSAAQLAFDLQHSDQVALTARAHKMSRNSRWDSWRRGWAGLGEQPEGPPSADGQLAKAPIILAAVDVASGSQGLAEALRLAALRALRTESGARLACVTVLKTSRLGMDSGVDGEGRNVHVRMLVDLKHWGRALQLPQGKVTYHVLQAPDVGAAILDFARVNRVDQIVIGSRGSSPLRRYLGSVSTQVVAQASCTVTVVKPPAEADVGQRPAAGEDILFD